MKIGGKGLKRHKEGEFSFLKGGEGEPFLLLHGIPGSAFAWEFETQAWGMKQLLDKLGIKKLYLGGHDFGGPVSLTLIRMFPNLTINGLVLSATNVFTDTYIPLPLRIAGVPFLNTIFFKAMVGNKMGMRMMYLAATKEKKEASWQKFERHLTLSGMDLTRRIFQRSLSDLKTNYQPIEDMLPGIKVPTLILWGKNDPFFSTSVGERIHNIIPESLLKIYEYTGHFVPEEQPSDVARDIMDFFGGKRDNGVLKL